MRKLAILFLFLLMGVGVARAQAPSAFPYVKPVQNDTVTGTTQFTLTKINSSGNAVIMATTDTTGGYSGVCIANCGTSGTAWIAFGGIVPVKVDGSTTANHYVTVSTTTGGDGHDTGASTYPSSGPVIGRIQLASTGAGSFSMVDLGPEEFSSAGSITINGNTCTVGSSCSILWNQLGNPSGNLSLTMAANTSLFTYNATTGSSDLFKLTDTASNTGTGILLHPTTASSSAATPFQTDANGIGWKLNTSGNLIPVSTGSLAIPGTAHGPVLSEGGAAAIATAGAGTAGQFFRSGGGSADGAYSDDPDWRVIPAANCNNTTAGASWSVGSGGTVTCRAGTNNLGGYVQITSTSTTFATFQIPVPFDWDTANNPYIRFYVASTDTTSGHTIIPTIQVACYKGDGTTTDDVAANAADSASTITLNTTVNQFWSNSTLHLSNGDMTGCTTGSLMQVTVGRSGSDTATNARFYAAAMTFPRLKTVQAN